LEKQSFVVKMLLKVVVAKWAIDFRDSFLVAKKIECKNDFALTSLIEESIHADFSWKLSNAV
jgi:hypothetical protein